MTIRRDLEKAKGNGNKNIKGKFEKKRKEIIYSYRIFSQTTAS